jgi:TolB-like protein/Flp pilus assembly protein TadD
MSFLQELRRRKVFRLAALYIVGAWVVLQVADLAFESWGIASSALRYVWLGAVLGLPIALIFSWRYDITSKGIIRTPPTDTGTQIDLSLRRTDYIILSLLLVVAIGVIYPLTLQINDSRTPELTESPQKEIKPNSIAVLPFVNLDANPDTGYFSDGVTEEILMRLSSLRLLHVIGQTSSFAFKNSTDGPARISAILGVRYLLQGSVRRDSENVRVTAKLIDESGFQVWGQTYDRKLESIFVIQSEIASSVSSQILNEIVPLSEQTASQSTTNMDAYNEYLVGRAFTNSRVPGWPDKAAAAFRRAIELDAGYAPPYAGLALAIFWLDDEGARRLVEQALELDPLLAEGHAIAGLTQLDKDNAGAERSLRRALELDPSLGIAYNWLAGALQRQGLQAEADALRDKGLEIDPLNPVLTVNVAWRNYRQGNFDRAEKLMLRLTYLPEPAGFVYGHLQELYDRQGRLDEVIYWWKAGIRANTIDTTEDDAPIEWSGRFILGGFETYAMLGLYPDAAYWLELGLRFIPDEFERFDNRAKLLVIQGDWPELKLQLETFEQQIKVAYQDLPVSTASVLGWLNILTGNYSFGIELVEPAVDVESLEGKHSLNTLVELNYLHSLAFAYEQVGRDDTARDLLLKLQAVIESLATSGELVIAETFATLALNHAMLGNSDEALRAFEKAVELGWIDYYRVLNSPVWATTVASPDFQRLLNEVKMEVDRQRAIVEAADAEHDFRAEFEQLWDSVSETDENP